jgi:hypothetical protein
MSYPLIGADAGGVQAMLAEVCPMAVAATAVGALHKGSKSKVKSAP